MEQRLAVLFVGAGEPFWCTNRLPRRVSGQRYGRGACLSCALDIYVYFPFRGAPSLLGGPVFFCNSPGLFD